jgi:hypothetical protein
MINMLPRLSIGKLQGSHPLFFASLSPKSIHCTITIDASIFYSKDEQEFSHTSK